MPHQRYYLPSPLQPGELLHLQSDEWHHLFHVSRGRKGERIELINGMGRLVSARIEEINKKEAILIVDQLLQEEPLPPPVILCLGLSRMNHLEWAVEKGTELGASAFWLFPGELSEKSSLSDHQQTRIRSLIIAATKQCGRLHLPEVQYKPPLTQWSPIGGTLFLCDPAPDAPYLWDLPKEPPLPVPILFFIGPEKGWSLQEIPFLEGVLKAKKVRLHPHILRAETAPLAALSLIQCYTQENSKVGLDSTQSSKNNKILGWTR